MLRNIAVVRTRQDFADLQKQHNSAGLRCLNNARRTFRRCTHLDFLRHYFDSSSVPADIPIMPPMDCHSTDCQTKTSVKQFDPNTFVSCASS